jgi:uncharacterized membrane protein
MNMNNNSEKTRKLVGLALFTAIVIVLQLAGSFIRLGTFSVSMVLVPIVVGAALYGAKGGMWLGLVFGIAVLLSGDAAFFMGFNFIGTIITVLVKGAMAGLCAGLVYKLFEKKGGMLPVAAAAVTAPVVNTGIFTIGCYLFFIPLVESIANGMDVTKYIFLYFIGGNFIAELLFNLLLCPVIVRLIKIGSQK